MTPPGSRENRFDGFDGLRAIAALSVLTLHVSWDSGFTVRSWFGQYTARLDIGVAVFFLISGFLLYRPFALAHLAGAGEPSRRRFWLRRAVRIFPAYWLALTVLAYGVHLVSMGGGIGGVVSHYGLLQIYWPTESFDGIPQAWSLATEISFYLFLPLYALAVAPRRGGRAAGRQLALELGGAAGLIAISEGFRWWVLNIPWVVVRDGHLVATCAPNCATDPALPSLMVTWLPAYLDLFGLGMLLAVGSAWFAVREREPGWLSWRPLPYACWGLALATYLWVTHLPITRSPLYFATPPVNMLRQALYGVFAALLLMPAVFGRTQPSLVRRLLACWPMASLGVVSYGIYLWHLDLTTEVERWLGYRPGAGAFPTLLVCVVAVTTAVAAASWFALERPLLRLVHGRSRRRDAPTAVAAAVPAPAVATAPAAAAETAGV